MSSVVISLDAELGWGAHHITPLPSDRIRAARNAWFRLIELFDTYRVPATWAVVGHLFLDECQSEHAGHPAGPRCCQMPAGDLPAEDVWFGKELIGETLAADVDHEIAGHGFTHIHFQHEQMSRDRADTELRNTRDTATAYGVNLDSFVYPLNKVTHRDLLAKYGFDCYRGPNPVESSSRPAKLSAALLGRGVPPIVQPEIGDYGLVNVPASLYLFGFEGKARSLVEPIRGDPIVTQVRRGLDALTRHDGVLHLWLHPYNVTDERDFERMRAVLAEIDRKRDDTDIRIETMGDVAARVRGTTREPRGKVR